jgi:hypothetical protein
VRVVVYEHAGGPASDERQQKNFLLDMAVERSWQDLSQPRQVEKERQERRSAVHDGRGSEQKQSENESSTAAIRINLILIRDKPKCQGSV